MAILSLADYKTFAGVTGTDATRDASLTAIIAQVDAAIKKLCRPFQFESGTATNLILDLPSDQWLLLPLVPVRGITSLYVNEEAHGDATEFTSDHLLTVYDDYRLEIDMPIEGWSRSGRVERVNYSSWGGRFLRPLGRLHAGQLEPVRGAIKITFTYGLTSVPSDVVQAAALATSLIYERRQKGGPVTSESWNGYSASIGGQFTATAAIQSPDVLQLLLPYMKMFCGTP